MSRYDADHLYRLLPAVYRQRDDEQGGPLRELVEILAEQAEIVERDIARLYDDWFIETCEPWVVPYLGDLIGVRPTHATRVSRRAEVANTLAYRRAKGTLAVLERLARDTTGWPARAVEMFERLSTTQHLNHVRPRSLRTPDLRRVTPLEHLGGPFETAAHAAELRRIEVERGKYNIPNVALFLWRLGSYRLDGAAPAEDPGSGGLRFTFDPLGMDRPLFQRPETEESAAQLAEERHVPGPLRRRGLFENPSLFGPDGSLNLYTLNPDGTRQPLPHRLEAADLRAWDRPVPAGAVAIDPVLGRIAFPAGEAPDGPLRATWHYGFSDDLGGGPYEREATFTRVSGERVLRVPEEHATLGDALAAWAEDGSAVIVIGDSATYDVAADATLAADARLEIRAANEQRPTLRLTGPLRLAGGAGSEVELNGLLIAGNTVEAAGALGKLRLRHCTLAPAPASAQAPLVVRSEEIDVIVERSILGTVRVSTEARVTISDSIVDAGARTAVAFAGLNGTAEDGALSLSRVTVIGRVHARELPLVENSLLLGTVTAARRQAGCVRFSWIPLASRVPRRFGCQPEIPDGTPAAERARLAARLAPRFTSLRFDHPGYCQLRRDTPDGVRRGAEDESEMGAFSGLRQPQREDDLRVRLDEYLRVGLAAGLFFPT